MLIREESEIIKNEIEDIKEEWTDDEIDFQ